MDRPPPVPPPQPPTPRPGTLPPSVQPSSHPAHLLSRRPTRLRRPSGLPTLLALAACTWAPAQEPPAPPQWVKGSFIGSAFVLSFLPETTDWVAVEESGDGVRWNELVNVAALTSATVYADLDARSRPSRIYRLRSPGTRSAEALQRWNTRSRRAYRFHLDRVSSAAPFLLQANVEVRDDTQTLTEVISDGFPLPEGDPEYFPAIDTLFARLEQARLDGAPQVWASYEPTLGFPSRCTLDQRGFETASVDGGALVQYRVSNLVLLPD